MTFLDGLRETAGDRLVSSSVLASVTGQVEFRLASPEFSGRLTGGDPGGHLILWKQTASKGALDWKAGNTPETPVSEAARNLFKAKCARIRVGGGLIEAEWRDVDMARVTPSEVLQMGALLHTFANALDQAPDSIPAPVKQLGFSDAALDAGNWSLIASNLIALVFAVVDRTALGDILLVYWFQSLTIGFFWVLRMLNLKEFSTEGFTSNGQRVPETRAGKASTAMFFAFHYGFFHFVYMAFLGSNGLFDLWYVLPLCALFLANHLFAYRQNPGWEPGLKPNLGEVMFFPYLRILPMHMIILAGGFAGGESFPILIVFMGVKTGADVLMHQIETARFHIQTN